MALADYYDRSATAVSQIVAGFDATAFRSMLDGTCVGVSFGDDAAASPQGRAALDLAIRLLARLYPTLDIRTAPDSSQTSSRLAAALKRLARATNPNISLAHTAHTGIVVGVSSSPWRHTAYAGSDAWSAAVSLTAAQRVARTNVIYGAGAAACLAVAAIFRLVVTPSTPAPADATVHVFGNSDAVPTASALNRSLQLPQRSILVGAGAVGQACAWALARTPVSGTIVIADPQTVDLGNMQRYVLTTRANLGKDKASLAAAHINRIGATRGGPRIRAVSVNGTYADALEQHGHTWDAALAGVDSAADRRAIQATLPRWAANAWTQTGDLGVSDHHYRNGACIACLYLPAGNTPNQDELVAAALRVPDRVMEVRTHLHLGTAVPMELCDLIADRLGVEPDQVRKYAAAGIRAMYVEGVCGGGLIPLGAHQPAAEMHVPLAHQSALAGVLLAARLIRRSLGVTAETTEVMRLNLSQDLTPLLTQPAGKDPRGICLCQDATFANTYNTLWPVKR